MEDRSKRLADSFGNARFGRFFYKKRLLENLPKLFFYRRKKDYFAGQYPNKEESAGQSNLQ